MYAQTLMKEIVQGMTTLFNSIVSGIITIGAEDYPALKAGNTIGGVVSAVVGLLGPLVNSVMNLVPGMMGLGDRFVDLTMNDTTAGAGGLTPNAAYHTVYVSENLPKLMGNDTTGVGYLLNATRSIGVDGTSDYSGDPQVAIDFMEALYTMLAKVLAELGDLMANTLPQMFPWG